MERRAVQRWLDAYAGAWETYDPAAIGAAWLERRDPPGTYQGGYAPLAVDGDVAVARGRSRYAEADGVTPRTAYDNIFVPRFDADGRCAEFRKWYSERSRHRA